MPTFKYIAKDADARPVNGQLAVENRAAAIDALRKRKLTIISVEEIKGKAAGSAFAAKKVKPEEIVIFSRQLSTMVDAGIPILQALDSLQDQIVHPLFKKVIGTIREDIQHGNSLSAAFAKHNSVFVPLFINMIKVGETGGVLSAVLDRVSTYMEKSQKLQGKVKSAMIYPIVVVSMAMLITVLLLVKVVPTFAGIYASFGKKLPAMTQLLIDMSNCLKHYILFIVIGLVAVFFGLKKWHTTDKGARAIDGFILRIPIFGPLLCKVAISRFSRTLATLIQSGVPILESLDIVSKTIGNRVLEDVMEDVKNSVREGESIAAPLSKSSVFPPMVTRMIAIGEKSGQMEKMLSKIAEFYDDQVDAAVDGLTSIIEPLIIAVLGVVIGFIVIALFLPIMTISQIV
ncbi:MAG: type II secretion system F family protein [Candidatus Omnitrophica bacterium]|nr:type II secretion system F family protein [Candidatus Omnitrophota bacterium]